ncbi:LLM class flavin-dependent oxidoreductase [Aerococcus urinaeequi]|uniref:LLM class flavin-dependent oxidoreductase n=1 Tax=Aerococcus viridans TaxID=1377 RepID=UPI0015E08CEF|nr:LLM class flavin-dependent oxidoreductase [Aerococcus viridans]
MLYVELGVHDLVTINKGESAEGAIERTMRFVQEIEKLNYNRYWFAEHHNMSSLASVSPEMLVAYAAAKTNRIHLGTGGTMIMHYSPLKIAENFKTLTALAPGRIDIGLGRAPGSGPDEIKALAEGRPQTFTDMYDKIQVILDYLADKQAPDFYGKVRAMPQNLKHLTEPWMLGSSGQSALVTAQMGLGYAFAKFFGIETDPDVFKLYRDRFEPSAFFQKPKVMVSYMIIVGETDEEADYLAKPIELVQMGIRTGQLIPNMTPEEAKDYSLGAGAQAILDDYLTKRFIIKGSKETVKAILDDEIESLGIDEILVYAPIFDEDKRLQSYRYLAEMFDKI